MQFHRSLRTAALAATVSALLMTGAAGDAQARGGFFIGIGLPPVYLGAPAVYPYPYAYPAPYAYPQPYYAPPPQAYYPPAAYPPPGSVPPPGYGAPYAAR